jgi:hypothetical protein
MESAEEIFDVERAIESEEDTDDENEEKEIDAAMEMQHKEKQKIREYEVFKETDWRNRNVKSTGVGKGKWCDHERF